MHPEILAQQVRDHHDDLRREAAAARLAALARSARHPHVDEPSAMARRASLAQRVAARLASA
jgi:hypothetical protein